MQALDELLEPVHASTYLVRLDNRFLPKLHTRRVLPVSGRQQTVERSPCGGETQKNEDTNAKIFFILLDESILLTRDD